MKKQLLLSVLLIFISGNFAIFAQESAFSKAIKTCQPYSKSQNIVRGNELFNIAVTLENKNNSCVYKEKISQGADYYIMTCNFEKNFLDYISGAMEIYNDTYKKEIAKENIFEAKMTSNQAIVEKYLSNPKYCNITSSKVQ